MLAEWYRAFAAVGHSDQREDRLWMAEMQPRSGMSAEPDEVLMFSPVNSPPS